MKKLLLIEDNEELRENTSEILELAGYEVFEAENGKVGVEQALTHIPDLIICDIMMPELDGYEVLHLLSKNPKTAVIPFIFLTAKSEKTDFRRGMSLGADDYITKPYKKLDLLETIEKRLLRINNLRLSENVAPKNRLQSFLDAGISKKLQKSINEQQVLHYRSKQVVYMEGESPRKLYFLKNGKLKDYRTNDFGKELIVNIYKEGDFFGYQALIKNKNYESSVMALDDCEIVALPKDIFFEFLYFDRDVSTQFIKLLSNQLIEKEAQLIDLAYQSVRVRVAKAILTLLDKNEEDELLKYSREDIANLVGTSTETAIRTISDFKKEKIIVINKEGLKIIDKFALQAIAED